MVLRLRKDFSLNATYNPVSVLVDEMEQLLGISKLTISTVGFYSHFDCANPTDLRDTYPLSGLFLLPKRFTPAGAKWTLRQPNNRRIIVCEPADKFLGRDFAEDMQKASAFDPAKSWSEKMAENHFVNIFHLLGFRSVLRLRISR